MAKETKVHDIPNADHTTYDEKMFTEVECEVELNRDKGEMYTAEALEHVLKLARECLELRKLDHGC